jgi:hypothetical protein
VIRNESLVERNDGLGRRVISVFPQREIVALNAALGHFHRATFAKPLPERPSRIISMAKP